MVSLWTEEEGKAHHIGPLGRGEVWSFLGLPLSAGWERSSCPFGWEGGGVVLSCSLVVAIFPGLTLRSQEAQDFFPVLTDQHREIDLLQLPIFNCVFY